MTKANPSYLLLAPPGGGKTHFCLDAIRRFTTERPFDPVWVIVRDRLQAEAYRRALTHQDLRLGVEVATFSDFYRELLARSGAGLPVADEAALHALIRAVLNQAGERGTLVHFARVRAMPGFVAALRERIAELKGALVHPAQLEALAQARGDAALLEIAGLYAAYQSRLHALGWADEEGLSWLGLDAVRANPRLLEGFPRVVVDGFDSFNPAQRQTVQALAGRVGELLVTLPGNSAAAVDGATAIPGSRLAHRRFARALRLLTRDASFDLLELPAAAFLPAEIAALEQRLFEPPAAHDPPAVVPPPVPPPEAGQVMLFEARSQDDEVREALRWIKARVVRDGLSPSACALIVPDFAAYRPSILSAAAEFGIPLDIRHNGRLGDMPPLAALLDLLALHLRGFPTRLLLDTIRAPFFDLTGFGLCRDDARPLDWVSRSSQVVEGLPVWQEVLSRLAAQTEPEGTEGDDHEEDDGLHPPALPKGARAEALWQGLLRFSTRLQPPPGEQSAEEWVRWLAHLLADLRLRGCCLNGAEPAWLDALDHLLAALSQSERLAGPARFNYAAFMTVFQAQLAGAPAVDHLPYGAEAVAVLHTFDARGLRFAAAVLVGLAESVFPEVERADPFLSEDLRATLGMDPRLGQDQAGIFYQLIARADQKLLLTRPYLAADGETWEPSPFWNAAVEALAAPVERVLPEDRRPLADAASAEELLFWAARRAAVRGQALDAPYVLPYLDRSQAAVRGQRLLSQRLLANRLHDRADPASGPLHNGDLSALQGELLERFGAQAVWSASRLESYATCPFLFLTSAGMGLEMARPPKAGFETFQLGAMLHEVLETVYRDCPDPGDVEALLELLTGVAARVFAAAPARYAFRPTLLWEVQQAELLETLRAAVIGLSALDAESGWQPEAFECRFGIDGAPFLQLPVKGLPVRLRGVIDRIDRDRHGNLRVIDYKSGGSHLASQDLLEGRRLQLPLYALAAETALGLGRVAEGLYWKLFAGEAGGLRLARFESEQGRGAAAAEALAVQHVERVVSSIRQGHFHPQPPEGGCPSYCQAASWCWSYQPRQVF